MSDGPEVGQEIEIDETPSVSPAEPVVVDPDTRRVIGTISEYRAEFYSGPLPSAAELGAYNEVSLGLADVIVTEWRTETAHRRRLEQYGVTAMVRGQKRGQLLGFVIAFVVILCGATLTAMGKSTAGVVTMLVPVGALASIFVYSEVRSRT